MSDQVKQKFYKLFWSNEGCKQIFTLHKEELLLKEEIELGEIKKHHYVPRFVISNSLKRPDAIARIEQRIENRTIDLNVSLEHKSNKNLPAAKIDQYLTQKLGRPIELFSIKMNGNRFTQIKFITEVIHALGSEKRIIGFLQKYEVIGRNINTMAEMVQWLESSFEKEANKIFTSEHFSDALRTVEEIAGHYNNYNYESLLDADHFYEGLLYDKQNYKERSDLFDSLFEANVLEGGVYKAYYECIDCDIDVFSGSVTLKDAPGKVKLKCPNCGKETFHLVPYRIHQTIYNDIISNDGLLGEALSYLLQLNKLLFIRNSKYGKDIEFDLEVFNEQRNVTDIIEVKMFKADRPDDVLIGNMAEGLRKFIIAYDKMIIIHPRVKFARLHYITNIDKEELHKSLRQQFQQDLLHRPITIHSFKSIKDHFENIRK